MTKSIIAPLLVLVLFGLIVFYHEDMFLVAFGGNDDNDMMLQTSNSSNYSINTSTGDGGNKAFPPVHDDDEHWKAIINAAEASNYTCTNLSLPTSIHATLSANSSIVVSLSGEESDEGIVVPLDLTFTAYDKDLQPQKNGGDVFVVDYQSYWPSSQQQDKKNTSSNEYTVFKSSTFTHDHLNGTYSARLFFPRIVLDQQHVNVSLRHYYTCHEGLKLPDQLTLNGYHNLDFGPMPWQKASEKLQSVLGVLTLDRGTTFPPTSTNNNLPRCSENKNNEYILNGAWVEEKQLEPPSGIMKMSLDSRWTTFHCTLGDDLRQQKRPKAAKHYRIGDSTMPGAIVKSFVGEHPGRPGIKHKIGLPYEPYLNNASKHQHEQFLDTLRNYLIAYNFTQSTSDTFMYSGGLHHIFHGNLNVPATATLVLRTICQVGLTFPGNILLRGLNPIQQHQYPIVDITSLNVQRINWELHTWLRDAGRRLADVCSSIPAEDMASFVSLPGKGGNVLRNREAQPVLIQEYNYSWERDSTDDRKHLSDWIKGLSYEERSERYGDRLVWWINLEGYLLSRHEMYRKYDKIHDAQLFWGPEWDLLDTIEGYACRGPTV